METVTNEGQKNICRIMSDRSRMTHDFGNVRMVADEANWW